jgi:xanthine dehydrogenase accessory factor
MTKEIRDILNAYKKATTEGRQSALATVVHVEGSSYRRPGARMLVEDNGKLTGAISGGCLEGDAFRKAMLAMADMRNKLVTYNSMDEDDIQFGVQLGCNGIVHILFEPIDPAVPDNPIALLEACCSQRRHAVLATLFSLHNFNATQPCTCLFYDGTISRTNIADKYLEELTRKDATEAYSEQTSSIQEYMAHGISGFIEFLQPPVALHIVGAGNDAFPLVDMATVLGWQITIIDGRATHANRQRFAQADTIIVNNPEEAARQLRIDDSTVFILMTHNYHYDLAMMRLLLPARCRYIGALGPKKRLDRMLQELEQGGLVITEEQKSRIYGPTGLDIGAESPEEIALSILAEIKAVLAQHPGTFLRNKTIPIHPRAAKMEEAPRSMHKVYDGR